MNEEILVQEFANTPAHIESMKNWMAANEDQITIIGETRRPYRRKTKGGKHQTTSMEMITIFYQEK